MHSEIKSLGSFVEHISAIRQIRTHSDSVFPCTMYRGQASLKWGLSPKLYRDPNLFRCERACIKETIMLCPDEFQGLSKIEMLIKLQHYGLPTRLLDFSQNPLVALFFACKDSNDEDGAVYMLPNYPTYLQDFWLIDLLCSFILEYSGSDRISMNELYATLGKKYHIDNPENLLKIMGYQCTGILPHMTNKRILNQQGCFLIFGTYIEKAERDIYGVEPNPDVFSFSALSPLDIAKIYGEQGRTYIIPAKYKMLIIKQLDAVGINEQRLFPELENQTKYVWDSIKRDFDPNYTTL